MNEWWDGCMGKQNKRKTGGNGTKLQFSCISVAKDRNTLLSQNSISKKTSKEELSQRVNEHFIFGCNILYLWRI